MMGYGSSSNLSPLAPPFTVDRSFSNPLVDLTEPVNSYGVSMNNTSLHNWVSGSTNPPNSAHDYFSIPNPEFEPLVSETQYIYSPSPLSAANYNSQHHHVPPLNANAPSHLTSFVKGNAYYPSYVPPAIAEESNPVVSHQSGYDLLSSARVPVSSGESSVDAYAQGMQHSVLPWGGLWEGMTAWQQSNPEGVFCSNNDVAIQGLYSSNYRSKYDGGSHATNAFGSVKHAEAANSGQMDYKSYRDKSSDLVSANYPAASSLSTSSVPVTFPHASLKAIDPRSPLTWDSCLNDGLQIMKPTPGVAIRMPEAKHPSSAEKLCVGKELNDNNFLRNNPSIVKEANTYTGFVGKVCLDDKDIGFHLKQSEQSESRKCVSGDDLDQLSCATIRIQVPYLSVDAFTVSADDSKPINSFDNSSSNNLDHHNPAVDSPCWKGAPTSRKSPFEVSDSAPKQDIKRPEAWSQSDFQGPQIVPPNASIISNFSPEKPNENSVQAGDGISENPLAHPKKPISREELDVEKPEFSGAFASYSQRMQIRGDICELSEEYARKLIDNSDLKIPLMEHQNPEEAKCSFGKSCTSRNDVADVGINLNDDSDDCSSQVPYDAIENVLCSPPSAENVNNIINRSHIGASAPKTCVRTMLNTMRNLSELLLFSCSNDKNDLKEEDYETLESIINNLDMCVLKNVDMMTSMPGSFNPHRANSQPFTSSVHKDVNENSTQSPQVSAISQHIVFGKEHNTFSGKEEVSYPVRTSAEIGEDKTTQAIKNILDQNFHDVEQTHEQALLYKNLWLEAEASLCSVNYIARFNRMKMEMEKQKENDKPPNSVLNPNLVSSDTQAGKITEISAPEFSHVSTKTHAADGLARILGDFACDTNCLKTSAVQKVSISNISADHISDELASTSNKGATPDATLQHSCGQIKNSLVNDVTTSFLNLKSYDGNSSSMDGSDAEQYSGSNYLLDPIKVRKSMSASNNEEAKPGIPRDNISVPITTSHVDDVIARFHILKNRIENSNSQDDSALEKSSSSKDSSELSNVDKLSHEDKSGLNKNTCIQDFYMGNSVPHADDVPARFQVLTSRAEKFKSEDTSVVENLSSSSVLNPVNADKVENDAKDGVKRDTSFKNSVTSGTTSHIDDEEAFFMARYQILKQRVDNSGSMRKKIHQPDQLNLGYGGHRMHWPNCKDEIWDRTLNMNVDPLLQSDASKHGLEKSTVMEYFLFSRDDPMAQSECSMSNRIEDQPLVGCYDNGSSDWEHILKEELTGQNS